ncbi:hypothetical protein PS15m_007834 [Mucor circinelloides]
MLPEDELDFEDFGDLGDVDGPELTNEELEALEQELRSENVSTLNKLEEDKTPAEKTTPSITTTTEAAATAKATAAETQKENQDTVNNTLEEGETPNDSSTAPSKPTDSQHRSSNQQQQHQSTFNNYNNYKNNGYHQNGFYGQQPSMPMNNMFPQYPPFSNRIYVNPKFNKGAASQQIQLQQQQQRQFMELEAHRMLLMQRQMQVQQQQEQQRLAELDQKRREAAEHLKRKREQKNPETGEKRSRPEETDNNSDHRAAKRIERFAPSPAGGITIKGVAAARHNSNLPPRNIPYQPPNERKVSIERGVSKPYDGKPSITSRLGKPGNSPTTSLSAKAAPTPNKNSPASIAATPVLPIVTNGKSNTLIIKGLGKDAKLQDIRDMAKGAHDVKLDSNASSATVVFPSVESAVTFRRKYNRFQMGDSHINITFQK